MNKIVALPIVAVAPTTTLVMPSEPDPIFAVIEAAWAAKAESDRRYARVSKLYAQATKNGLGVDSSLDDKNAFVEARLGCDPDIYTDETADAYWKAVETAFEVTPTTLPGALALLEFADRFSKIDRTFVESNVINLVAGLTDVLLNHRSVA